MAHDCLADGRVISASKKRENQTQAFPVNSFITEVCSTLQQLLSCPQLRAWHSSGFTAAICQHCQALCVVGQLLNVWLLRCWFPPLPRGFTTLGSHGRALWGLKVRETLLSHQRLLKQGFGWMESVLISAWWNQLRRNFLCKIGRIGLKMDTLCL